MRHNHLNICDQVQHGPWRRIAALLTVIAVIITGFGYGEINASAAPSPHVPVITVTLNGTPVSEYDESLLVKNDDKLAIRLDFDSDWLGGESCTYTLPSLFSGLTKEEFEIKNKSMLDDVFASYFFVRQPDKTTVITLKFNDPMTAASPAINFEVTLNKESLDTGDNWEVDIGGDITITIEEDSEPGGNNNSGPTGPNNPRGPVTPVMEKYGLGQGIHYPKNPSKVDNEIFNQDTDIENAFYYGLRLNDQQNTKSTNIYPLGGFTMKDTLPEGMRLFVPNAPGYAANEGITANDYSKAYKSFSFVTEQTRAVKIDGKWYFLSIEGSDLGNNADGNNGELAKWVEMVNKLEQKADRFDGYTVDDLAGWKAAGWSEDAWNSADKGEMLINAQYFCKLNNPSRLNADGKPVIYGSWVSLGYKIDTSNQGGPKIHIYAYTSADVNNDKIPDDYEYVRNGAWANLESDKCIPLHNLDGEGNPTNSVVTTEPFTETIQIQLKGTGELFYDWTVTSNGKNAEGYYSWDYELDGETEFGLFVSEPKPSEDDPQIYVDEFWVEVPDQAHGDFMIGRAFEVKPFIWFDKTNPKIQDFIAKGEGTQTFENTASYGNEENSHIVEHTYTADTSSTYIRGMAKAVDKYGAAPGETLTYTLKFSKRGDTYIAANMFSTRDKLDANLEFVENSLEIYLGEEPTLVSTSQVNFTQTYNDQEDKLHLKAEYDDDAPHSIYISNFGNVISNELITVKFKAKVKENAYGALIPNTFGTTVNTNVDHKLKIRKVDGSGSVIENNSASFSVGYTTDTNYETATLQALPKPDSTPITTVTTGADGTIAFDYRLDDGEFYIKLTETDPPDGYSGLSAPIWIYAKRGADNAMSYELAQSNADVTVSKGNDGIVQVTVPNEPGSNPPPDPPEPGSFKLTKRVVDENTGDGLTPDPDQEFVFTVEFATATDIATPTDVKVSTDSFPDEKPFVSGDTVSLKADETATFTGILSGMTYEITEEDYSAGGYTPAPGNDTSGVIGEGGKSVVFTNNYAPDIPPDNPPDNPPDDDDDDDDDDPPPRQPPQNTPPPEEPDNPNDDDDFTPIGDTPVPLANLPRLTTIFDDGIPLARLPTSGASRSAKYTLTGLVALVLGFLLLKKERR